MEREKNQIKILAGIPASPGIAIGEVHLLDRELLQIKEEKLKPEEVQREIERFRKALKETRDELLKTREKVKKSMASEQVKIFDAQILILEDEVTNHKVIQEISESKINAEFVYKTNAGNLVFICLAPNGFRLRFHSCNTVKYYHCPV